MYLIILSDCIAICMCVCGECLVQMSFYSDFCRFYFFWIFSQHEACLQKMGELGSFFIGSDPARWDPHFSTPLGPFGWFVGRLGTFGDWKERKKDTPERESGIIGAERVISLPRVPHNNTINQKIKAPSITALHLYGIECVCECVCVCVKNSSRTNGAGRRRGRFLKTGPGRARAPAATAVLRISLFFVVI
jgi:hypothetical protein